MNGSIRALLVDDPESVERSGTALERANDALVVETATDADEALDRLAPAEFDCVVSEYDIPGRDGIEFLRAVREAHPALPFVMFTAEGDEAVASEAISAGVTDYVAFESGGEQYAILADRIDDAVPAAGAGRRRHLERILETVPSCVVRLDREGRFVYANDRAADVLGLETADVTDRTYNDPEWRITDLDGEPIPDEELPFRQVRDSGEPLYGYRHMIEWPDGTRKALLVNGAPLFDDSGAVESVVFSLLDITDRVDRETRLREATARLEALFEGSPDMINIHDAEGRIIEPNPRLCEATGYSRAELADMRVWEIDRSIDPEEAYALWEGMAPGDTERLQGSYRRRDGSTFPVEVHVRRIDFDGAPRFVAISRDTSDRRERRRELERQNERLEEFTSVVSHDLRNPLNVAEGRLELAREECESEHLPEVARAHERMEALIEDLLTLAREGEVGSLEPVDLDAVAEACWGNVDTSAATLVAETGRTVLADHARLQQLLENLFRNAVEHGGDSVTITIAALEDGFAVADDGPGIPPEDRERVFESGYSGSAGGTGFGLAIVEQIVEAHGWEIAVGESDAGGARFEITNVDSPDRQA
ncbi:MAG: PAS domain S-box protein [Halobacteriales archaeon]